MRQPAGLIEDVRYAVRSFRRDPLLGALVPDKPKARCKRMSLAGLLIESIALELDYSVATAVVRHFAMLPTSSIEQI